MGFFDKLKKKVSFKNLSPVALNPIASKKKVSLKNVSPIVKVGGIVQKTGKKVIKTGKFGLKDALAVSTMGIVAENDKTGASKIKDFSVDKPQSSKDIMYLGDDTFGTKVETNDSKEKPTLESGKNQKPKNNLIYAGLGLVALLGVGYVFYKMKKK